MTRPITLGEIMQLLNQEVVDPDGRVITRRTELITKRVVKDQLSNVVEKDGVSYVRRTQFIEKTEIVETYYELS